MKTVFTMIVLGVAILGGTVQAEVYKCPGSSGHPIFTEKADKGCEPVTVKPVMPTEQDIAEAKAYNARKDEEAKARATEDERRRQKQSKEIEATAAARAAKEKARAQREAARIQQEADEIARLRPYFPPPSPPAPQ